MDSISVLGKIYSNLFESKTIGLKASIINYDSLIGSFLNSNEIHKLNLDDQLSKFLFKLSCNKFNSIDESHEVFNTMARDTADLCQILFTERNFLIKIISHMYNIILKLQGESKQLDDLRLQTERQNLKISCLKDEIKSYK